MLEKARSDGTLFAIDVSTHLANGDSTGEELSIDRQKRAGQSKYSQAIPSGLKLLS